jgi:glycosyltransferase involved in cell wall biosynthesis
VVATSVGGVSDLVEDGKTGLLVPPRAPKAFSGAMEALLGDPDRGREMGRLARETVYPKYSHAALIDRMDRLYSSLLQARAGRRSAGQEIRA